MTSLFLSILNMSLTASWLIIAVILIRVLTRKAPKGLRYVLWVMVAVRLLCPISIESTFSLIPNAETFSKESIYFETPEMHSGVINIEDTFQSTPSNQPPMDEEELENAIEYELLPDETVDINDIANTQTTINQISVQGIVYLATWIWCIGLVGMLSYSLISVVRLRNTLKASMQIRDNLWVCDDIRSPFIFGLISPRIYLPSFIDKEQIPYIVAHENEHLKYRDHWWKPLGFAILTIHWFNPLVWISYILLCRDIELACDERVIRAMDEEEKKKYSKSLLLCSSPRHIISACPVAFGEIGIKERIKSILDYKKPSAWVMGIGLIICIVLVICFMTNPKIITFTMVAEDVAKIELLDGNNGDLVEITDEETISYIADDINEMLFKRGMPTGVSGGWSYWIKWYDASGKEIDSLMLVSDNQIREEDYFYESTNGTFDIEFFDELLSNGGQDKIKDTESDEIDETETTDESVIFEGDESSVVIEIKGESLSENALNWFETEFFNTDENLMPNMFLASEYDCPENIDLNDLFYGGSDGRGGGTISEEERQLLQDLLYPEEELLDVSRTTAEQMNEILMKYMNITLEDTNKVHLESLYYLPEYDAYYKNAGDTEYSKYEFLAGWTSEDGSIVLVYQDALNSIGNIYQVTLKYVNGSYYFLSNIKKS